MNDAAERLAEMELQKRERDALAESLQPFFDGQKKQDAEQAEYMQQLSEKLAQRNAAERERQEQQKADAEQPETAAGACTAQLSRVQYSNGYYRMKQ